MSWLRATNDPIADFESRLRTSAVTTAMVVALAGCGNKAGDGHDPATVHGRGHSPSHSHGHSHGEESPSGASFKAGKGVTLTDETRKILGVEIADVAERILPGQIPLTIQVFGEKHFHPTEADDHSGCDTRGSGFVATNTAALVKAGQAMELTRSGAGALAGVVLAVQKALALGEAEIVVGVSNATTQLKPGEFVPARIHLPRAQAVTAIPLSALLRTTEGTFVYAVNGDAYFRTAVHVGAEADGWVEVTDGLLAGDQVVTQPVETLWLVELRATKGGGHSH